MINLGKDLTVAGRMRVILSKLTNQPDVSIWYINQIDWGTIPSETVIRMIKSNSVPGYTTSCNGPDGEKLEDGSFYVKEAEIHLDATNEVFIDRYLS